MKFFTAKDLHGFSVKLNTHGQAWDGCNGSDELLHQLNAKLTPILERMETTLQKLLNKVNAVTAPHRHGYVVPEQRLHDLSNRQLEAEAELASLRAVLDEEK